MDSPSAPRPTSSHRPLEPGQPGALGHICTFQHRVMLIKDPFTYGAYGPAAKLSTTVHLKHIMSLMIRYIIWDATRKN